MKSILAFAIVSVLSLTSIANDHDHGHHHPVPSEPHHTLILGQWTSDFPLQMTNRVLIHTRFNFTPTTMTMHATCDFRGPYAHLTVGVQTHAGYDHNLIYVYDTVDASVNDGYRYCNAAFRPSTWEVYFNSPDMNRAILFAPVPYQWRINVSRELN